MPSYSLQLIKLLQSIDFIKRWSDTEEFEGFKICIDGFVRSKQVKRQGVKYMQSWEEKILIKQEGKLEGKQELMRKLSNKFSIEQISEILEIDILEVENILKESQK